jgi:hypothetical protein
MSDEPGYLKALRDQQRRQKHERGPQAGRSDSSLTAAPTRNEREAIKWAREVAGQDPQVSPTLRGAVAAILFKPASIDDRAPITLEGVPSREALAKRLQTAASYGHEVLGLFEVSTTRPLTASRSGESTTFSAGAPRILGQELSPEQMIRRAAREAQQAARTRRPDERGRGGKGR